MLISLPNRLGLLAAVSPSSITVGKVEVVGVLVPDVEAEVSAGMTGQEAMGRSTERVVEEASRPCRMAARPRDMV